LFFEPVGVDQPWGVVVRGFLNSPPECLFKHGLRSSLTLQKMTVAERQCAAGHSQRTKAPVPDRLPDTGGSLGKASLLLDLGRGRLTGTPL
jgi:hypothetical protein